MHRLVALSAASVALTLSPAVMAKDDQKGGQTEAVQDAVLTETEIEEVVATAIEAATDAIAEADIETAIEDAMEAALESEMQNISASPVQLVEWTGDWELMKTSRRLRVWRSHLAYRLTVDAAGEVTDCELTEKFRMRHVSMRLCDVLSQHHTFQPAHDDNGSPVEGSYSSRLSYMEIRERL